MDSLKQLEMVILLLLAVLALIQAHSKPMIIIGGILQENPFFVPPDEFLRELRGREAKSKVA